MGIHLLCSQPISYIYTPYIATSFNELFLRMQYGRVQPKRVIIIIMIQDLLLLYKPYFFESFTSTTLLTPGELSASLWFREGREREGGITSVMRIRPGNVPHSQFDQSSVVDKTNLDLIIASLRCLILWGSCTSYSPTIRKEQW